MEIRFEVEHRAVISLFHLFRFHCAKEPVFGDFVFRSVDFCFAAVEFSNDWKKDVGATAPDAGVGFPDQLATGLFFDERAQFGSAQLDGCREVFILNRDHEAGPSGCRMAAAGLPLFLRNATFLLKAV